MSGFARQVLKWLQGLDLGIPIKHPKRDFANGYLIAVIFSRYYPGELRPWSLYTGNSETLKENNWMVLEKCVSIIDLVFKKHVIDIPREAIDAVMHCQNGAAIRFVENIYTLLTKIPVKHSQTPPKPEIVPHFALPTTANAIRAMAESPEKAKIVLNAHNDFLKELRHQRRREMKNVSKQETIRDTCSVHEVIPQIQVRQ